MKLTVSVRGLGAITRDGRPIRGGVDINQLDFAFCGAIYPRPGHEPATERMVEHEKEWPESEDVAEVCA